MKPEIPKPAPKPVVAPKPQAKQDKPTEPNHVAASDSSVKKPEADEDTAPSKKLAPPSADEQKRLTGEIDEVYKPGDAKDPAAKAALARKLLEEGRKHEANRAEQFVFFRRAGEMARDAGEADLALEAVDAIVAAGFDFRPYPVKARLLKRLAEQAAAGGARRFPPSARRA